MAVICKMCKKEVKGVTYEYGHYICIDCKIQKNTNIDTKNLLWCVEGDFVICTETTAKNGTSYDKELISDHIELGATYTVKSIRIGRSCSTVVLYGIEGIEFNTVNFERALYDNGKGASVYKLSELVPTKGFADKDEVIEFLKSKAIALGKEMNQLRNDIYLINNTNSKITKEKEDELKFLRSICKGYGIVIQNLMSKT